MWCYYNIKEALYNARREQLLKKVGLEDPWRPQGAQKAEVAETPLRAL